MWVRMLGCEVAELGVSSWIARKGERRGLGLGGDVGVRGRSEEAMEDMEAGGEIEVKVLSDVTEYPLALEVVKLSEARAKLRELGPRPDPLEVEEARKAILLIQDSLQEQAEVLYSAPCPHGQGLEQWQASQVQFFDTQLFASVCWNALSAPLSVGNSRALRQFLDHAQSS